MTRRAIFVSEFWPGATARGLAPGFRELGWQVEEFDSTRFLPESRTIGARLFARATRPVKRAALGKASVAAARARAADVLLTVKGNSIDPWVIKALRDTGVRCINFLPDYHFNDVSTAALRGYDLLVTTKSFHLAPLTELVGAGRCAFVHHGYSGEFHRPLPQASGPDVDISYVGNHDAYKEEWLSKLALAMPEARLRIVGHGWTGRGGLSRADIAPVASGDFYAAEVSRAKISVGLHRGSDPRTGYQDLVSTRTFEIPACGGFMLHIDNPEVRTLYDVGREIDAFADLDELVAKCRRWLADDAGREAVARAGHARCVPAYDYRQRAHDIATLVEQRLF